MKQLFTKLTSLNESFIVRKTKRDVISSSLEEDEKSINTKNNLILDLEKSLTVLEKLVFLRKKETVGKIEKLVSFGLQAIFEDSSYRFEVRSKIARRQVSYEFRINSDSFNTEDGVDILSSRGGGLVNIVSFLLRLVILLLLDSKAERFLVLDEPFNNLSETYHENLVNTIKEISEKLNFQLLIITHQKSLEGFGDRIYEIRKVGKESKVKQLL